jgi:uncharacterized membrane protein
MPASDPRDYHRPTMDILSPFLVLIAVIVLFFLLARGQYRQFGVLQWILRILAALPLVLSAVFLHFLHTNEATAMLPPIFPSSIFPSPRHLVILTGVLEILGAIGLFIPRVRRSAALWIAIMMVMIFIVNIWVAGQTYLGVQMPTIPVRCAMQVVYVWIVLLAGYGIPKLRNRSNPA